MFSKKKIQTRFSCPLLKKRLDVMDLLLKIIINRGRPLKTSNIANINHFTELHLSGRPISKNSVKN
ncbi:hypothetical protein A3Q56_06793 [Intoshia linei]|uniref:Uncharacterized protein n=1 Tax=Intoshia linei TaxID=1819745 RepID=A0A177ATY8_9BILA|nr:hypothetical protein A3Q56_06793 [Intoshia linei]